MGVLNPNSTPYVHPNEPNLLNIHKAMEYRDGVPHLRVNLGTDNITITGNVNIVDTVSLTSATLAALESINVQNTVSVTVSNFLTTSTVYQGTIPWVTTVTNWPALQYVNGTVYAVQSGTWSVGVTGSVAVTNFTSTVVVSNTVTISNTSFAVTNFPTTSTVYQGTNPWVVTGNVSVANTQTDLTVADSNYYMNLARGLVDGQYVFFRSAMNPSVNQDTETSVWVEGGIYPHGIWTTPQRLYAASDNTADTGQTIFIEGLDSNYNYTATTVTTNGLTAVSTTQTFIRIHTATVISSSNNSANAGEIRFRIGSSTGTIVAHIRAGFGTTKLSQYTVPAGYTAYVVYGDATSFRGGSGNIGTQVRMMVRPYGGSFVVAFIAEVVNGYYRNDFTVPLKVTEKSDIDIRVIADANNTIASCNYQMILIPN